MAYLLDTNVLLRLADTADATHAVAGAAVLELHRRGETLHVAAQCLIEFRSVATRPVGAHGMGLASVDAEAKAAGFEAAFPLLPETGDIYPAWKALVAALGVIGRQVHDARLAAICHVHNVSHILTFNVRHFARLAAFPPGLAVVDPATV